MKAVLSMYVLDRLTHIEDNMPDWGMQTATELSSEFPKAVYWVETEWSGDSVTWVYPWDMHGGDFDNRKLARNDNETIHVWEEYDLTDAVKELVEGTRPNYGFFVWPLTASLQDHYGVTYASSEFGDQTLRPKLTITTDGTESIHTEKNETKTVLRKNQNGYAVFNPFNCQSSITVINIQGKTLIKKQIVQKDGWYTLPCSVPSGIHIVTIHNGTNSITERISLIR